MAIMGLVLSFFLTSCDSDDKDSPKGNGIVGTWKWTYSDPTERNEVEITFKSNGSCTIYSYYIDYESGERESETGYGSYEYNSRTGELSFRIKYGDEIETSYFEIEISGDKMYLTVIENGETMTFRKVS